MTPKRSTTAKFVSRDRVRNTVMTCPLLTGGEAYALLNPVPLSRSKRFPRVELGSGSMLVARLSKSEL